MNLKEYLDEKRMTYREFAEILGIHLHSLKNIVYGKRNPGLALALKIEIYTDGEVTTEDLMKNIVPSKLKRKSVRKQIEK